MPTIPQAVSEFLAADRIAVAGVSRSPSQPANTVLRRLRATGHAVVPVNPNASELEGEPAYPDLALIPGTLDAVMIATHPAVSAEIVRQAAARGIGKIWFHRSFGTGSVSPDALRECEAHGIHPIVGGCPLMYCGSVDLGHRCIRWWLGRTGRVPL